MCDTCGCDGDTTVTIQIPGEKGNHSHHHHHHVEHEHHSHSHSHHHSDSHNHDHSHDHSHASGTTINIEQDVLVKNNMLAERNRGFFEAKGIFVLNMMSSPGAGKTTLLEKTITDLKQDINFSVVEGDQQTLNDAERIKAVGVPAIQINTGNGCHLDSDMINQAIKQLKPADNSIMVIENVGNLVCPAMFDLGESKKVVIISTTEGEDKPIKYPTMFNKADICIINKIDLLPYLDFDVEQCKKYALQVNHHLEFFEVSAKSGEGLENWYNWLKAQIK